MKSHLPIVPKMERMSLRIAETTIEWRSTVLVLRTVLLGNLPSCTSPGNFALVIGVPRPPAEHSVTLAE